MPATDPWSFLLRIERLSVPGSARVGRCVPCADLTVVDTRFQSGSLRAADVGGLYWYYNDVHPYERQCSYST